ncbi:MAG: glycosyltransferase family protein [Candidatus Omnitrophica bacterium]|nr:glycosyltransferase family protein [Candidatus Omnitrophota bacterium]
MKKILGKPMLELMVERVKRARFIDEIVIATSVNPVDDAIKALSDKLGVKCFRGSEDDVLDRVLKAVKHYGGEHIVELWGDTPLIDPLIIDEVINYYFRNKLDLASTCLDRTFPWGMSVLVFPTRVLDEVSLVTNDPVDRENVSNYIYEHPEKYKIGHLPCPPELNRPEIRLTVDEEPDFELVKIIFEKLGANNTLFSTLDIIRFLDKNPEFIEINKYVKQRKPRGDI